jgi:hypothetical protein
MQREILLRDNKASEVSSLRAYPKTGSVGWLSRAETGFGIGSKAAAAK